MQKYFHSVMLHFFFDFKGTIKIAICHLIIFKAIDLVILIILSLAFI